MKKLFLGILSIGLVHFCTAQTKKNSDVKFTPPVIKKDKESTKTKKRVVFTPPVIKKDKLTSNGEVKFTPPVIKKDKPVKAKKK